jgi:hypothetical protein
MEKVGSPAKTFGGQRSQDANYRCPKQRHLALAESKPFDQPDFEDEKSAQER